MTATYINIMRLDGDELDRDFRNFCKEKGFNMEGSISVVPIPCLSGHDAYIISQDA